MVFFSFSAPSFADDISDFQIEGMSIGDSLLDFMDKNKIDKFKKTYHYATKEYYQISFPAKSGVYETIGIDLKNNDGKFFNYEY